MLHHVLAEAKPVQNHPKFLSAIIEGIETLLRRNETPREVSQSVE